MGNRNLLVTCRNAIEAELRSCVGDNSSPLYDMIRYHLGWVDRHGQNVHLPGGKMLRPILCLLSCHAVGGDYRSALPAAAAIEMVHNFSLIHDDIQDRSSHRRHRATLWSIWGEAQAINAGDGLHVLAHLALARLPAVGIAPDRILATMELLDRASLDLCEGQYLDISFEAESAIDLASYLRMIGKKTAALLAASTRIGAMLGTDDSKKIEGLCLFGKELGMAFQIQDDILGIWGVQQSTGKPALDDIRARKKSLPIVYAMASAAGEGRRTLEKSLAFRQLDEQRVAAVLAILEETGSRDYCQSLARSYWEQARSRIESLALAPEAVEALKGLAEQLMNRAA